MLNSRFVFDRSLPVSCLLSLIGSKSQIRMQREGQRPHGIGLLIAGHDNMGPHILQVSPSVLTAELCPLEPILAWTDMCLSLWSIV